MLKNLFIKMESKKKLYYKPNKKNNNMQLK